MNLLFFLISFGASIIGAICGLGGGIIIKPTLDAFHILSVATISFLSGITVLSMSAYSVSKAKSDGNSTVNMKVATPLAIGAVVGGIIGKMGFDQLSGLFKDKEMVGAIQALFLIIITIGTLVYTLKKDRIKTKQLNNILLSIVIGTILGVMSSFLGIGGGPINLVVFYYFFSMQTKEAAQSSLYIIFFSQISSLIKTLITGSVPDFELTSLLLMIAGGVLGAIVGRRINSKIDGKVVEKLFIWLMVVVILINIYNVYQFLDL
jgi:uncharacterized membrane protein YfcA